MIYTITFNPALDYIVQVEDIKTGLVNRTQSEEIQFGGKGINVSTVLHNLGIPNVALGFLAGFTGEEIYNGLKRMGINTDFIFLDKGMTRINVKIKSNQETEINGNGPLVDEKSIELLFKKLEKIQKGDVLVLAGSIPSSLPSNIYEQIMERFSEKEVIIVVDATKDLLVNVLKYKPFLIKPNNHELSEIFNKELNTEDEIKDCAKILQERGARNVLVSMASKGAILLSEDGVFHKIGVPEGKVVNSVGAGDSMVAGFIAGWLEKKDYDFALKLGTATGSATVFSKGLATKQEVYDILEEI